LVALWATVLAYQVDVSGLSINITARIRDDPGVPEIIAEKVVSRTQESRTGNNGKCDYMLII